MSDKQLQATRTVDAPAEQVFALLTDPARHRELDPYDTVRDPIDAEQLTREGQQFGMHMDNEQGPTGGAYRMVNTVSALQRPTTVAWQPTVHPGDRPEGLPAEGGWEWRWDLEPAGDTTRATLTYDWSGVSEQLDAIIGFPPFEQADIEACVERLAEVAARG